MDPDLIRLARNLKTARAAKGITQPDAAAAVRKTRQTIVNWENPANSAEPSSSELATLATLYGVSAQDLRFAELERQAAAPRGRPLDSVQKGEEKPPQLPQTTKATRNAGGLKRK